MSDRLEKLQALYAKTPDDPFVSYGIAMEHKSAGRLAEALGWLDRTITLDSGYCYAYYQLGEVSEAMGNKEAALDAYHRGVEAATVKGDGKALSELRAALQILQDS